jgi:hypothetical protein
MNEHKLSESTIQRLAFIKYLYNIAVGQSHQPEPLAAASILMFHDSIELFLQLACEHLDAETKTNTSFIEYWEILKPKMPNGGLTQKESMKRLNKSRVALKHHGILPTKIDIEAFRASAINFFEDNTSLVFGTRINEISMINLIVYESVKTSLKKAEEYKEKGDLSEALVEIAIAFKQLINAYEASKRSQFGHSPFFFGEDMTFESSFHMGLNSYNSLEGGPFTHHHFADFVDKVRDSIQAMREAIKILSLGLDYRRYTKFQLLTPYVIQTMDGKYHCQAKRREKPSIEEYEFCYNFVIDSAIRLQDFDFDVKS